jgi:hypothetical protein
LAARLGEPLKGLQVPSEIVTQIVETLKRDQQRSSEKTNAERSRLEARMTTIHMRMDDAYIDKRDGKIPEDFWNRKTGDWRTEEQQVRRSLDGLDDVEIGDRVLGTC